VDEALLHGARAAATAGARLRRPLRERSASFNEELSRMPPVDARRSGAGWTGSLADESGGKRLSSGGGGGGGLGGGEAGGGASVGGSLRWPPRSHSASLAGFRDSLVRRRRTRTGDSAVGGWGWEGAAGAAVWRGEGACGWEFHLE
jgi:hypothetical protein